MENAGVLVVRLCSGRWVLSGCGRLSALVGSLFDMQLLANGSHRLNATSALLSRNRNQDLFRRTVSVATRTTPYGAARISTSTYPGALFSVSLALN